MKKIVLVASVAGMLCGCAAQMVQKNARDSCAKEGKRAFIFDAQQNGVPLLIESASARVLCVGPDEVTHLPTTFGADAVSASNLSGAGILAVTVGSVADKAGVKEGDIIAEFAGSPIANARELSSYIERASAGEHAMVKIRRNGKDVVATAVF